MIPRRENDFITEVPGLMSLYIAGQSYFFAMENSVFA